MNIVYAMTRNVYEQAVPSIRSLMHHNPKAKVFLVIEDDTFPYELPCDPTIINVSEQGFFSEDGPNFKNRFTYINLMKVCYQELLSVNKVIHLDIDTIVCDSLEGLWKTDLKGKWFGAVPQYRGDYVQTGDAYYNCGVMVINLQQMRKDEATNELGYYVGNVPTMYADQDAWNLHTDKAVPVPARFNENWATGETDDPAIVHYCGISDWYTNPHLYRKEYLDKWKK